MFDVNVDAGFINEQGIPHQRRSPDDAVQWRARSVNVGEGRREHDAIIVPLSRYGPSTVEGRGPRRRRRSEGHPVTHRASLSRRPGVEKRYGKSGLREIEETRSVC